MKKIANSLLSHLAELVLVAGVAAVAVGVGMIYLPAGLIAGGVLTIIGAVVAMAGGSDSK